MQLYHSLLSRHHQLLNAFCKYHCCLLHPAAAVQMAYSMAPSTQPAAANAHLRHQPSSDLQFQDFLSIMAEPKALTPPQQQQQQQQQQPKQQQQAAAGPSGGFTALLTANSAAATGVTAQPGQQQQQQQAQQPHQQGAAGAGTQVGWDCCQAETAS